jgi:hypothetical protein
MGGAIVNITLPGDPHKNNATWLRAVCEDAQADTIRRTVTQMMRKPSDFQIGSKRKVSPWDRPKKRAPVVKGDEDAQIPGTVNATVEKALDSEPAELVAA